MTTLEALCVVFSGGLVDSSWSSEDEAKLYAEAAALLRREGNLTKLRYSRDLLAQRIAILESGG